jgi:ankyrin repeat protein
VLVDAGARFSNHEVSDLLHTWRGYINRSCVDMVKFLLESNCSADQPNRNGTGIPLFLAIDSDHLGLVQALLAAKPHPNLNRRNAHGSTPLTHTVQHHKGDIVGALLRAGAEGVIRDEDMLPLLLSANEVTFDYLLQYDPAAVNLRDEQGRTVLHMLCEKLSKRSLAKITVLLGREERGDLTLLDRRKLTPLDIAADCLNAEAVRLLMSNGVGVSVTEEGSTLMLPFRRQTKMHTDANIQQCLSVMCNAILEGGNDGQAEAAAAADDSGGERRMVALAALEAAARGAAARAVPVTMSRDAASAEEAVGAEEDTSDDEDDGSSRKRRRQR